MKKIIRIILCLACVIPMTVEGKQIDLEIKPNCSPVNAGIPKWEVSFCGLPETESHDYPTDIRFSHDGKVFFNYVYMASPTGGPIEGVLLGATKRFALLEVPGDEANHLIGFDLEKKMVVFNTGYITGMNLCKLNKLTDDGFCEMTVTCPIGSDDEPSKNYAAEMSEYLCR